MTKMPWRYCPVVVDASGRYNFGRVKLPGTKKVDGPEVDVPRKTGSYHLDYRENGVRSWPTVIKVLSDAGRNWITADNLSPRDITDAIGIVERRLNAIRHGDIEPVQRKPKKLEGLRLPLRNHVASVPSFVQTRVPTKTESAAAPVDPAGQEEHNTKSQFASRCTTDDRTKACCACSMVIRSGSGFLRWSQICSTVSWRDVS
jgi:hypothetical protein